MVKFKTIVINCAVKSQTRESILASTLNNMGPRLFILVVKT